jgi:putative endonuclease
MLIILISNLNILICKCNIRRTTDADKRVYVENTTEKGFTARYRPWEHVWLYKCKSKEDAIKIEKKIKSWKSKKMIERLIAGDVKI